LTGRNDTRAMPIAHGQRSDLFVSAERRDEEERRNPRHCSAKARIHAGNSVVYLVEAGKRAGGSLHLPL